MTVSMFMLATLLVKLRRFCIIFKCLHSSFIEDVFLKPFKVLYNNYLDEEAGN